MYHFNISQWRIEMHLSKGIEFLSPVSVLKGVVHIVLVDCIFINYCYKVNLLLNVFLN